MLVKYIIISEGVIFARARFILNCQMDAIEITLRAFLAMFPPLALRLN